MCKCAQREHGPTHLWAYHNAIIILEQTFTKLQQHLAYALFSSAFYLTKWCFFLLLVCKIKVQMCTNRKEKENMKLSF